MNIAPTCDSLLDADEWSLDPVAQEIGWMDERLASREGLDDNLGSRLYGTSPIFDGLSAEAVRQLLAAGTKIWCRPGDVLMTQGEKTPGMMVVLSGAICERRQFGGRDYTRGTLTRGAVTGTAAVVGGEPCWADVTTETGAEVVTWSQRAVRRALRAYPEDARKLRCNLHEQSSAELSDWADALLHLQESA